jgi:hypothetical protein
MMQVRNLGCWLVLAAVAIFIPGAYAGSYIYSYTGNPFGDSGLTNNAGDIYQFQAADSVTATVTLDAAIPTDSYADYASDPGFTPDLLAWSITAGGVTLSSDNPNANLVLLNFTTTGDMITFWQVYAYGTPLSPPADLVSASINTFNGGESISDEGFLQSSGESNNNGEIDLNPGTWSLSSSDLPTVPEPATISMVIGGLAFLGKKRFSSRRATR